MIIFYELRAKRTQIFSNQFTCTVCVHWEQIKPVTRGFIDLNNRPVNLSNTQSDTYVSARKNNKILDDKSSTIGERDGDRV